MSTIANDNDQMLEKWMQTETQPDERSILCIMDDCRRDAQVLVVRWNSPHQNYRDSDLFCEDCLEKFATLNKFDRLTVRLTEGEERVVLLDGGWNADYEALERDDVLFGVPDGAQKLSYSHWVGDSVWVLCELTVHVRQMIENHWDQVYHSSGELYGDVLARIYGSYMKYRRIGYS